MLERSEENRSCKTPLHCAGTSSSHSEKGRWGGGREEGLVLLWRKGCSVGLEGRRAEAVRCSGLSVEKRRVALLFFSRPQA